MRTARRPRAAGTASAGYLTPGRAGKSRLSGTRARRRASGRAPKAGKRVVAYDWPPPPVRAPGPAFSPGVFRGLWCRCGATHRQEAAYYVSVKDGERVALALGPFQEHHEALARVGDVRLVTLDRFNPDGRAHWYGFGTVAMRPEFAVSGVLNALLLTDPSTRGTNRDERPEAKAPR